MIREMMELGRALRNRRLTRAKLESLRERKLRAVIRNAYDHVPYYRSLFRSAGVTPEDIRTVEDLKKLPVTTKDDLRMADTKEITADWVDLSTCVTTKTHGSTGKPLVISQTPSEHTSRLMLSMASFIAMGVRPRDRLVILGQARHGALTWYQRLGLYRSRSVPVLASVQEQLQQLEKLQPTVLVAYPSALRALAHFSKRPLRELISPRIIIHAGEVFDQVLRRLIKAHLDAELFNYYAAHEVGPIGWECPSHEGLHLNAAHHILECPDGEGQNGAERPGPAVVTSLIGHAMPFIRYHLGDLVAPMEKGCSCGCSFPLLDHPVGRENDMVTLPSGKVLSPAGFGLVLRDIPGMSQWRLIQERHDHFVLKLVMKEKPRQVVLGQVRQQFLAHAEEPVKFDIELVDYIDEGVKFRYVISKVNTDSGQPSFPAIESRA